MKKFILPFLSALLLLPVVAPPLLADDTLENQPKTLLDSYWTPASATTVICTNVAPSPNNIAKASWMPGRAQLESVTLTIVATNASTADVNVIIGPSSGGSNVDHTINFFKFKLTLTGTTPVSVVTNIPSGLIGGAKYLMVYSVQNAHTALIKTTLVRSGWNR